MESNLASARAPTQSPSPNELGREDPQVTENGNLGHGNWTRRAAEWVTDFGRVPYPVIMRGKGRPGVGWGLLIGTTMST